MKTIRKQQTVYAIALSIMLVSCKPQETTMSVRKDFEEAVFTSGYVTQENEYMVSAKVEGIIFDLPIREGDSVTRNDLIAVIEGDVQEHQLSDAMVVYHDAVENASSGSQQLQHLQTQIDQAREQLRFDKENYLKYKDLGQPVAVSISTYPNRTFQAKISKI
jgi:multidrug resistance efflux pump